MCVMQGMPLCAGMPRDCVLRILLHRSNRPVQSCQKGMTQLRCAHHFLQRVWIGLGEKNLEFDKHEINLRDEDGASTLIL